MSQPLISYRQLSAYARSSPPPNPSDAPTKIYGQFDAYSNYGLAPLRKPEAGEFSYRKNPPTSAPPNSQHRLPVHQDEDSSGYASGTRLGVQDPVPSVSVCPPSRDQSLEPEVGTPNPSSLQPTALSISGHNREEPLSELDRNHFIAFLPFDYMKSFLADLHEGNLTWVSLW
jgi:hypothetical protein